MESVRVQLAELQRRDRGRMVFGANKHRYQSSPVTPAEVTRVEAALGIAVPLEYRRFLLDVGHGAGPYYGLWSPAESLAKLQSLAREYEAEEQQPIVPSEPFPLTIIELCSIEERLACGDKCPYVATGWPCNGCMPICHQGCTFWSVLILAGEFVGRVWDVACQVGYSGEWMPARRPSGWWEMGMPHPKELPRIASPPTFGEWYAGWIERCLTDLSS